ncbi:MAG TPA: S8 family serine peptidase [Bacteroidota bacterium]|nr:S8 family serine peptidase [Bacteroidota bacterium]
MHTLFRSTRFLVLAVAAILFSVVLGAGAETGNTGRVPFLGTPVDGTPVDNKIDPGLRFMISRYEAVMNDAGNSPINQAAYSALFDGSLHFKLQENEALGQPTAPVFLKLQDPSATIELERLGVRIRTRVEDIFVADVPITSVYSVASLPYLHSMTISGQSAPLLNLSRTETRVDQVHAGGGGLDRVYRGSGVLVGVVDSGIDWAHPDFSTATNNTRIQWILDYGNAGQSGQPTEWTKAQIDAGQCTELDGEGSGGHGTHVTGIAAGGGRRNTAYVGMAPGSDIVFVKGIRDPNSNGGFQDADVIAGVQFIFNKAASIGKPAVANLSLGGQFGPHDGTSLYEQALSKMVKPGNIIVAAAGNEGASSIHTSFTAQGTSYATAPEVLWEMPQNTTLSAADMWYPGTATMSVGIGVYAVNGGQLQYLANTNPVTPGNRIENVQVTDQGGTVLGTVTVDATTAQDPNNGARNVLFVVQGSTISQYVWTVYAFGSGTLDAWVITGGRFVPPVGGLPPLYKFGDNDKSVGTPGTSKKVVCVGAYVSKNAWVDVNNVPQVQPGAPVIGNLSSFSSHGPSRDGRTKPDFVAPGEAIISALSSGYTAPPEVVLQGGGLQKQQGTSQASPHVAGIVALLLERNKYLTYENVVSLLGTTATPAGTPNTYGAGKVNALNALIATPPAVDCVTLAKMTGFDCNGNRVLAYELLEAYPNPFNPATTIGFRLANPEQVTLAVYDMLGRQVRVLSSDLLGEGLHNVVWDGRSDDGSVVASGVYFSRLATPTFTATNRLVLLK